MANHVVMTARNDRDVMKFCYNPLLAGPRTGIKDREQTTRVGVPLPSLGNSNVPWSLFVHVEALSTMVPACTVQELDHGTWNFLLNPC